MPRRLVVTSAPFGPPNAGSGSIGANCCCAWHTSRRSLRTEWLNARIWPDPVALHASIGNQHLCSSRCVCLEGSKVKLRNDAVLLPGRLIDHGLLPECLTHQIFLPGRGSGQGSGPGSGSKPGFQAILSPLGRHLQRCSNTWMCAKMGVRSKVQGPAVQRRLAAAAKSYISDQR